jgi:hypothetical protein
VALSDRQLSTEVNMKTSILIALSAAALIAAPLTAHAARPCRPSLSNFWTCPETDTPAATNQKRQCDTKWRTYKAQTGARGWHDYFVFMAKCTA